MLIGGSSDPAPLNTVELMDLSGESKSSTRDLRELVNNVKDMMVWRKGKDDGRNETR